VCIIKRLTPTARALLLRPLRCIWHDVNLVTCAAQTGRLQILNALASDAVKRASAISDTKQKVTALRTPHPPPPLPPLRCRRRCCCAAAAVTCTTCNCDGALGPQSSRCLHDWWTTYRYTAHVLRYRYVQDEFYTQALEYLAGADR
jgi:hypothetical protein